MGTRVGHAVSNLAQDFVVSIISSGIVETQVNVPMTVSWIWGHSNRSLTTALASDQ
jgi:hypothetical protein